MHKSMQKFVARLSWFLAVMAFLAMTFVSKAVEAQTVSTHTATVTLAERERFERVYVGLVEGYNPEIFERCVRWGGEDCPDNLYLPAGTHPRSVRALSRLGASSDAIESPGTIAAHLLDLHTLSASCLLDTSISSPQERAWRSVSLSRSAMLRYPLRPSKWVSHRCVSTPVIYVRPHRPIEYLVAVRPAEGTVHDFIKRQSEPGRGSTSTEARRDLLTRDVRALIPVLGSALPPSAWRDVTHTLLAAIQDELSQPPRTVRVTTTVRVPIDESGRFRNLQIFSAVVTILAAIFLIVIVVQGKLHKDRIENLEAMSEATVQAARDQLEAKRADIVRTAHAEGKKEGIAETEALVSPVLDFILSAMLGASPKTQPGSIADRLQKVFVGWGGYIQRIENRGRDQAKEDVAKREAEIRTEERKTIVATLQAALSALAARLKFSFPPIPDGEVSAVAAAIEILGTGLEQRGQEEVAAKTAARPVAVTRGFGESPGRDTPESLSLRQARDAADLLKYIRTLAATDDPRREVGWEKADVIAVGRAMLQDVVMKFRTREEDAERIVRSFTDYLREAVSLLAGSPLEKSPREKEISEFGLGSALRSLREVLKMLRDRVKGTIQDARIAEAAFWDDPPESVKGIVDTILGRLPSDDPRCKIIGYQARAQAALVISTTEITFAPVW